MDIRKLKIIIIGLIFIFVNITILNYDILPDFIGYILMIIAFSSLKKYDDTFKIALIFTISGIFFSIFGLIPLSFLIHDTITLLYIIMAYGMVMSIVGAIIFFLIFAGMQQLAKKMGDISLKNRIEKKKIPYTILCVVSSLAIFLPSIYSYTLSNILIRFMGLLLSFVLNIVILVNIIKFTRDLLIANDYYEAKSMGKKQIIVEDPWGELETKEIKPSIKSFEDSETDADESSKEKVSFEKIIPLTAQPAMPSKPRVRECNPVVNIDSDNNNGNEGGFI